MPSKFGSLFQYGLSARDLYTAPAWPMEAFMNSSKRFSSSTQRMRSSQSSACLVLLKMPQL
jgi:hypothetical protein